MNVLCVIPARYASTRLPGKPLKDIAGKLSKAQDISRYKGRCKGKNTVSHTDSHFAVTEVLLKSKHLTLNLRLGKFRRNKDDLLALRIPDRILYYLKRYRLYRTVSLKSDHFHSPNIFMITL